MIISKHWLNEWVDLSEVSGETLSKTFFEGDLRLLEQFK